MGILYLWGEGKRWGGLSREGGKWRGRKRGSVRKPR